MNIFVDNGFKVGTRKGLVRDVMRFHLVYSGPLSASANKSKLTEVVYIREYLSPQIEYLWETHPSLQILKNEGARSKTGGTAYMIGPDGPLSKREMAGHGAYEDLCKNIVVDDGQFLPLVRQSLDLSCEIDILFLRQQDPGALISQGGDIDGRIKLLLDALRMPSPQEQKKVQNRSFPTYCLMESDTLVSRLNIDTDRLLIPQTNKPNEVHLVMDISINVLRVGPYNTCLL